MASKAIIITDEMVDRLEKWLNHLDKLSVKYWTKAEEAEKAGDEDTEHHYRMKTDRIDDQQIAALKALDMLGFSWKCDSLNDDGTETLHLILP